MHLSTLKESTQAWLTDRKIKGFYTGLSLCLFVCLSVCLFVGLFVGLSLFVCLFVCLCAIIEKGRFLINVESSSKCAEKGL